jgi:lipid-A-disaccharide synthase
MISFDEIANSEMIVTIPGTNTAKIAARGIPMVVVFPLNHPEVIPMEGLAHIFGKIPVMGKQFKKWVAALVNKKTKYFALPNQKADQAIVPEIRGEIEPLGVALKVVELIADKPGLQRTSHDLIKAMGEPGAAKKIVEELDAAFN